MTGNTLDQLIDVATGKLPHADLGACPDQFDPSSRDRACPACRAIEAALRLSAGADWQPIETAPKDRTDILIAGGTYSVRDYQDLKFSGVGIAFWDRDHWHGNEDNAHDEWCRHQPTHWQPIPAAPRHEPGEEA